MKRGVGIVIILLAVYFGFSSNSHQRHTMRLNSVIMAGKKPVKGATVNLYLNQELKETITTSRKGIAQFSLHHDNSYMVEVIMPGFVTKRIMIDTRSENELKTVDQLSFKVNLLNKEEIHMADDFYLDFPFAFISFNDKKLHFQYDISYSEGMKLEEEDVVLEARQKQKMKKASK